jgi:hypothetical protein
MMDDKQYDSQKGKFDGLPNKLFNARKYRKIKIKMIKISKKGNFDVLKNPGKSKENYKKFDVWEGLRWQGLW